MIHLLCKEVILMTDAVLILAILGAFAAGFYVIDRLGKALDEKTAGRRRRRRGRCLFK